MNDETSATVEVQRISAAASDRVVDRVAVEEPLEIRVGERPVSVTLRTPGHDDELAAGFLFTEQILRRRDEVVSIRHWGSPNVVRVQVQEGVRLDLTRLQRHFHSTSSCGLCGKTSIDALRVRTEPLASPVRVDRGLIGALPSLLRRQQTTFDSTGGVHGAAAFTADGRLLLAREDIGRHNAVDKVVGSLFLQQQQADLMVVSSRTSFEIVQKCVVARVPVLIAVGAPSTMAVELARQLGLTLIGFVRDDRFNVYATAGRVAGI